MFSRVYFGKKEDIERLKKATRKNKTKPNLKWKSLTWLNDVI